MGLQLFSGRTWEEDSFNETNVESIILDISNKNRCIYSSMTNVTYRDETLRGRTQHMVMADDTSFNTIIKRKKN